VLSEVRTFRDDFTPKEVTAGRNKRDKEKVSYGDVYKVDPSQGDVSGQSVEGILKQSEHLRLAQEKINELENELEELRRENDEIMTVADTFKALSEEYYEQMEKLKEGLIDSRETAQQENRILKDTLQEKDKQLFELKQVNADLKSKVEANFKQIRKRERDLEYRLELIKAEEATLLKTKDKTILDLRRRVDKLDQEMQAYRDKNKEHFDKLQQQQQTVRGVVRALRIALTRLEGDFGVDFEVLKKAE
jgi:chromosome segregation ATPase